MIEKIIYKKKLFALIVRGKYRNKRGINFFTPKEATQQFGYMKHKKGYIIQPHQHKKRLTRIMTTTEVILLLKGSLKVDFYNEKRKYLFSKILNEKDVSMASADQVKEMTGFTIGGVSPVGHLNSIKIIIDQSLSRFENIFGAAGHPNCVFKINFTNLQKITNGEVVDITE